MCQGGRHCHVMRVGVSACGAVWCMRLTSLISSAFFCSLCCCNFSFFRACVHTTVYCESGPSDSSPPAHQQKDQKRSEKRVRHLPRQEGVHSSIQVATGRIDGGLALDILHRLIFNLLATDFLLLDLCLPTFAMNDCYSVWAWTLP